jgi:hypothetical protein
LAHIDGKTATEEERDRDRTRAKSANERQLTATAIDQDEDMEAVVCFDLENVLSCPRSNVSNFFFIKRNLQCII